MLDMLDFVFKRNYDNGRGERTCNIRQMRIRGVFRTHSNICDGAFFTKINGFEPLIVFAKSSIVDVRLGSKYDFENGL